MTDLNQLWADEMKGRVPPGSYRKEFDKQYPECAQPFDARKTIDKLREENAALKDVIAEIFTWIDDRTKPNEHRRYSRCPICEQAWWDNNEQHHNCWVPGLRVLRK